MLLKVFICACLVAQILSDPIGLPNQDGLRRLPRSADPHHRKGFGLIGILGGGGGYDGGYNQGGYNQGYNQGGYNQGGYNQGGYNQGGYSGGQSQASAVATASAGSQGYGNSPGGYGNYPGNYGNYPGGNGGNYQGGGAQSQAQAASYANSQSFGVGPFSATFAQSGANAQSQSGGGQFYK